MIKVENKQTTLKLSEDKMVSYANLINTAISNFNMQNLVSVGQMRNLVKVMDVTEKAFTEGAEDFELENESFDVIKGIIAESKWPVIHKDVVEFADYIASLK